MNYTRMNLIFPEPKENEKNVFVFPFERGEVLTKINNVLYYQKAQKQLVQVEQLITNLEEKIKHHERPRGPRQDILQQNEKHTLKNLLQRKIRLTEMLTEYEKTIREDMRK